MTTKRNIIVSTKYKPLLQPVQPDRDETMR